MRQLAIMILGIVLFSQTLEAAPLQVVNQNNRSLVALRTISEELGARVDFDKENQKITIVHKDVTIEVGIDSKQATINGNKTVLQVAPQILKDITYVPIRFIGEALGGVVDYQKDTLKISLGDQIQEWKLQRVEDKAKGPVSGNTFNCVIRNVNGKKVTYLTINMNDSKVKVKTATANNTVTQAQPLKTLASGAKASVNGTYFAAYNGATPLPDGTIVSNAKVLHITDIGSTIGFTSDNRVLIDFVQTRVQGYVNGIESWSAYRVNRPTPDTSATILYTPEYGKDIPLAKGWSALVCINGKIEKLTNQPRKVPNNGFILVTARPDKFQVGDLISYKTIYQTTHTSAEDWEDVMYALSAGPSLRINGQKTGNPQNENFTEAKILTNVAQRSFIGITDENILMVGTVSASINQLKDIVAQLGLKSAMCLDGGASSGLYYNGMYLTSPGRNLSNSLNFFY